MRKMFLVMLTAMAGTQVACSSHSDWTSDPATSSTQSALNSQDVLGFETLTGWSATSGTVALSTLATQGTYSLALYRFSYSQLTSAPIGVGAIGSTISFDLQIPLLQPNPDWYGYVQLFLSAPSAGVYNQYIGQKDLRELTPNQFSRVDLPVPAGVQSALANGAADLTVGLVLNVPAGVSVYLLDNLRLGQPPATGSVPLPTGMEYCDVAPCSSNPPTVVKVCPSGTTDCSTPYHTTIVMQVNGRPIAGGFLFFPWTQGKTLVVQSGGQQLSTAMMTFSGPRVELDSYTNQGIPISYYDVAPVWGGVTEVNFEATTGSNAQVDAVFFRHPSYDTKTAFADLLARAAQATLDAQNVTGVTGVRPVSLFYPTEIGHGEGNFWDGRVNVNYGNPPWIDGWGGVPTGLVKYALQEYTHEYTHALFDQVWTSFPADSPCLNEGLANAVDVVIQTAPPSKLGPAIGAGGSFEGDCRSVTDPHDVGNCYFYHVYKAGFLTDAFLRNVFHPQRQYTAGFCHPSTETTTTTGDSLIVLFTEAAGGTDMTPVVNTMQLRNSGSYAQAKAALGF